MNNSQNYCNYQVTNRNIICHSNISVSKKNNGVIVAQAIKII